MILGNYDQNGDLIDPNVPPWYETVATGIATAYQLKTLTDLNADRARNGLPPLDMSAIAPQINVGLPPEQLKLLMIGVAAIVAAIYLSKRKN